VGPVYFLFYSSRVVTGPVEETYYAVRSRNLLPGRLFARSVPKPGRRQELAVKASPSWFQVGRKGPDREWSLVVSLPISLILHIFKTSSGCNADRKKKSKSKSK
jgi:hypothetical protein